MTQEPLNNETIVPEEITPPSEITPKKKRTLLWVSLGVVAVLILSGAAFLAGRLINNQNTQNQNGPIVSTGPNGEQSFQVGPGDFDPWPTPIPQTEPDTKGLFVSRQDNVLTIGTGNVTIGMKVDDSGGTPEVSTDYAGPQIEVVVTGQTKIYRDATMDDLTNGLPQNGQKIQRKIADGTLDELTTTSNIFAWGRRTGDRYIADVLIYSTPAMMAQPVK